MVNVKFHTMKTMERIRLVQLGFDGQSVVYRKNNTRFALLFHSQEAVVGGLWACGVVCVCGPRGSGLFFVIAIGWS